LGVVLAIAVVASPLAFGALFYHYHRTTSGASPDAPVRIAESTAQPSARAAGERPGGHESGVARTGPTDDRLKASNRASDWATIARLPGAAPLLTSPAIRELGLTEDQQRRIREIVDETAEAFKQLDAQFRGISRQEQSRAEGRLLEAARDEAFGLLTPEQRRQFQAATDKAQQP